MTQSSSRRLRRRAVRLAFWLPIFLHLLLLLLENISSCSAAAAAAVRRGANEAKILDAASSEVYWHQIRTQEKKQQSQKYSKCSSRGAQQLTCPDGTLLNITVARHRQAGSQCVISNGTAVGGDAPFGRCTKDAAMLQVKQLCDRKQHCQLPAATAAAANAQAAYDARDCSQQLPYLQFRFSCELKIKWHFICADAYTKIRCNKRHQLHILKAVLTVEHQYLASTCPNTVNKELGSAMCPDRSVTLSVRAKCDNKQKCVIGTDPTGQNGCARPHTIVHYACIAAGNRRKHITAPTQRDPLPQPKKPKRNQEIDFQQPRDSKKLRDTAVPHEATGKYGTESDSDGDQQLIGITQLLGNKQMQLLLITSTCLLLLITMATASCFATRRWLRQRRRREEEHLARVNLSKQLPPPATCLLLPAADDLLKLPPPPTSDNVGHSHTVSVCLNQLNSPPCSVDAGSDRQSSSTSVTGTSTFMTGTGSGASRAGSIPSPRESLTTYSVHQHSCTTAVLRQLDHELGRAML